MTRISTTSRAEDVERLRSLALQGESRFAALEADGAHAAYEGRVP